jgi:cation diffusion facilitator family transporter
VISTGRVVQMSTLNDQKFKEESVLKKLMVGALLLAVWGIFMAIASDSSVILLDGMFNLISAVMSFFSIEILRLVTGKETREYPFGYFAFESLFVLIKGASIMILLLMALYSAIKKLATGGGEPALGLMTVYVVLAVLGCLILYFVAKRGFKKTGSEILEAEKTAWLINMVVSAAIGVAFGVTMLLQQTSLGWIARYVDQILVIIFSIVFFKDPIILMKKGLRELLLAAPQREFATPFEDEILPLKDELGAENLDLEILKTGRRMWVTVRIDPKEKTINVDEFMKMREKLKKLAQKIYENTDTEVILQRAYN